VSVEVKKGRVTFQQESLSTFVPDAELLWEQHKLEVGTADFEMEIDVPQFQSCEAMGQLFILTARRAGAMIGYVIVKVCKHPHYKALCGFEDAYFVIKGERGVRLGSGMIEESLRLLALRGVKKVFFHSKLFFAHRELFKALGFAHSDEIWTKVL
jgi:hypothetical protein